MLVRLFIRGATRKSLAINTLIKMELMRYLRLNLTRRTLESTNYYLKEVLHIDWSASRIIVWAINHLKFYFDDGSYIVELDRTLTIPGTDYNLSSIVRLINYGNGEVKGTHVMSNAFNYLQANINKRLARMMY